MFSIVSLLFSIIKSLLPYYPMSISHSKRNKARPSQGSDEMGLDPQKVAQVENTNSFKGSSKNEAIKHP